MKLKFEKNMRVVTDLLGYLNFLGAQEYHMDMSIFAEESRIRVEAPLLEPVSAEAMDEMRRLLNMPRMREVEQNYWNISGEEEMNGELALVGMMSDGAEVRCEDGTLVIEVVRLHRTAEQ